MSYTSKYGNTKIRTGRIDNLSINYDSDNDVDTDPKHKRYPVLLFTPDMHDTRTHYHIQLSRKQADELCDWLLQFLRDVPSTHVKLTKFRKKRKTQ